MVMPGDLLSYVKARIGLWRVYGANCLRERSYMIVNHRGAIKSVDIDTCRIPVILVIDGPCYVGRYVLYDVLLPEGNFYTLCAYKDEPLK